MKEKLSEKSLEDLCIAIMQLRTEAGIWTNLTPNDVLQPWVMENIPAFTTRLHPGRSE